MALPATLYSPQQARELDARAIAEGTPSYTLMKRAGEAALRTLRGRWPMTERVLVVCGGGNNGGDGYVLARFARASGLLATALAVVPPESLEGDARRAFDDLIASGGRVVPFDAAALTPFEVPSEPALPTVVVDALLGIGTRLPLRAPAIDAIRALNACGLPLFALDLPSGLDGLSGAAASDVVSAQCTLSFIVLKSGLFLGDGPEHAGNVQFDDLGVSIPDEPAFAPRVTRLTEAEISRALPRRARSAHKGSFGRVVVIGGGPGMPGAARLAGEASLRVGAGLVTAAVASENLAAISGGAPELICLGVGADPAAHAMLADALAAADVIAVGPGLGRTPWAQAMLQLALGAGRALVIDADALNLLAAAPRVIDGCNWILTPHPGEAARLLATDVATVQADRLAAVHALQSRYGGIVVLKGAGTLIAGGRGPPAICERGNPGLATPGTGDVLTGAIAGILAQCGEPLAAAQAGVMVHALAGDALARGGERGFLASELARELRNFVNR